MTITLIQHNVKKGIPLPDESVDCVVTSPPYWMMRDYGVRGQIGLEKSPDCLGWARGVNCGRCHVCVLRNVFADVHRVLHRRGVLWLNYGDMYCNDAKGLRGHDKSTLTGGGAYQATASPPRRQKGYRGHGLKRKDLVGMPWRLALALQADGWYLRARVVWHKPASKPFTLRDRPSVDHEELLLLTRSPKYFFDLDHPLWRERSARNEAARVPFGWATEGAHDPVAHQTPAQHHKRVKDKRVRPIGDATPRPKGTAPVKLHKIRDKDFEFRNRRSVWTIPAEPTGVEHYALFPTALVRPLIAAGCKPGGTVLDPFCGTGTVLKEANEQGFDAIGIDLKKQYIEITRRRVEPDVNPKQPGERLLFA